MSCKIPRLVYLYSNKINIYDNNCFIPLPAQPTPLPPPCMIYQPLSYCGTPYPTPTYYPPNPMCISQAECGLRNHCTCKK